MENRRSAKLDEWPFGFAWGPRAEVHGAVIRELEPGGSADRAGVKLGDVVLTAGGDDILDAGLHDIPWALSKPDSDGCLSLEVGTPVMNNSVYLREASTAALRELMSPSIERLTMQLIPSLLQVLQGRNPNSASFLQPVQKLPKVFIGDAGTASRVHIDTEPRVQFCHTLRGCKLFAVQADPDDSYADIFREFETSCATEGQLADAASSWLSSPSTSIASCRAGDILVFWGGHLHGGANGSAAGPCVSLFHGFFECGAGVDGLQQKDIP
eukprot:TRINITY_DN75435_c0_g1_i1.p1 TRINITY_DN75435_c0_g1~~TRINITY_DN75435_c0_g1_i1.p1  ORF type:complete len:269 (-),score=22.51 TRINITY_DN75435_c0_g1_i1:133-939(-)